MRALLIVLIGFILSPAFAQTNTQQFVYAVMEITGGELTECENPIENTIEQYCLENVSTDAFWPIKNDSDISNGYGFFRMMDWQEHYSNGRMKYFVVYEHRLNRNSDVLYLKVNANLEIQGEGTMRIALTQNLR